MCSEPSPPSSRRGPHAIATLAVLALLAGLVTAGSGLLTSGAQASTAPRTAAAPAAAAGPLLDCSLLPVLCGTSGATPTATSSPTATATAEPTEEPTTSAPPEDPVAAYDDNPDFVTLPRSCRDSRGYMKPEMCRVTPRIKNAPTIVLWGDSHAWQMTPALRTAIGAQRVNLVLFFQGSCPPMYTDPARPGANPPNGCQQFGMKVLDYIHNAAKKGHNIRVVMGIAWELYHNALDPENEADRRYPSLKSAYITQNAYRSRSRMAPVFKRLGQWRVPTDVIGQMPMVYENYPTNCGRPTFQCDLARMGALKDTGENLARAQQMRGLLTVTRPLIRPAKEFCGTRTCTGRYLGVPTYFDAFHIGQRASRRLASYFRPTVQKVLDARRGRR